MILLGIKTPYYSFLWTTIINELLFAGLHSTPQNSKLTPQESEFVLNKILPSICRIDIPGTSGTGFVIGALPDPRTGITQRYVLTCYHMKLLPALRDNQDCIALFATPKALTVKILQPLYWSEDLDYVLFKLEASQELDKSLPGKVFFLKL